MKRLYIGLVFSLVLMACGRTEGGSNPLKSLNDNEVSAIKNERMADVSHFIEQLEQQLRNDSIDTLSDANIIKINQLSQSLLPYGHLIGDSLTGETISRPRGKLLLRLCKMGLDSISFEKVKTRVSFVGADLRGMVFNGYNLSRIDLRGADLSEAQLEDAKLSNADLRRANLSEANLKNANLRASKMDGVNLTEACLIGADLYSADMKWTRSEYAKLRDANFKGVDLLGAKHIKADLTGANFYGAKLERADLSESNLENANLGGANLHSIILNKANLTGVIFIKAAVLEEDWLSKLSEWKVLGAQKIMDKYKVVKFTTAPAGRYPKFRLVEQDD